MTRHLAFALLILTVIAESALAQESRFHADLRRERKHVAESCGKFTGKGLATCAYALTTDSPFHVAFGSLPPQNGFAFGLAFAEHYTPNEAWRISWNADAVAAPSGAWRGGAYMKLVHTPETAGVTVSQPGGGGSGALRSIAPREFSVIDVFGQTILLKELNYFGVGQQTLEGNRAVFGERETLVGVSAIYPLAQARFISALRPSLVGGVTGRFVDIRSATSADVPSIEQTYDETSAPGISRQRPFVELREGIRFKPSVGGWLRLNYLLSAQQFRSSSETRSSFNRWTIDLQHEIPLYRRVSSTGPKEFNGPNECTQAVGSPSCPDVQWSRNREGSIGFRLLVAMSSTGDDNRVPFYFQPTLGGSDLNGERLLASFQDYRFRASDILILQERFEHSIWGPFGAFVLAEQGKVASDRGDLGLSGLKSSTTIGMTLRAGGFPMVNLSFSWGSEGHHIIGSMNSTLLGGSARPNLF